MDEKTVVIFLQYAGAQRKNSLKGAGMEIRYLVPKLHRNTEEVLLLAAAPAAALEFHAVHKGSIESMFIKPTKQRTKQPRKTQKKKQNSKKADHYTRTAAGSLRKNIPYSV